MYVRRDAIRYFRHKKKEYLKATVDNFETNSKIKNIRDLHRGIKDFKKGYQTRTDIVKDENDDLFTGFHSNLSRRRNHFSQQWNVRGINDVQLTKTHTATPTMPELSAFEVAMAIGNLKHKSSGFDQIPTELIKTGRITICSETHKLIDSIWNKEELPEEWKELITAYLEQG
jgi:hypothetical protein